MSTNASPDPRDAINPQIPAGATETVQVFAGLVPASVAPCDAAIYYGNGTTATLIPTAS